MIDIDVVIRWHAWRWQLCLSLGLPQQAERHGAMLDRLVELS